VTGMVVRADSGGLAWQTFALARMLQPDRLMIIDSTSFNNGAKQYFERFESFRDKMIINGFPTDADCVRFLTGLNQVITCECPYNYNLYARANRMGIRTYAQQNYEFDDLFVNQSLPAPYMALVPSYWHLEDFRALYQRSVYLPPPTFAEDFASAREENLRPIGRRRFLHSVGKEAAHDRNGSLVVIESLKHTTADFDLVLKAQPPYVLTCDDPRVTLDLSSPEDQADLYKGYTGLLYPRRYGGLALPMQEALMSALPVIMPNINPNDQALPADWLVPATTTNSFIARTKIPIYDADPVALAAKIDEFCAMTDEELAAAKARAFQIGVDNYSADVLRPRYLKLLETT